MRLYLRQGFCQILKRRFLQLPLERPIQHAGQQRVEFGLRLRLKVLERIDLRLQTVEVGHDAALFTERR